MTRHIAIVGCGAIARLFYLPAIARNRDDFGDVWFVDPSDRATVNAASIVSGKSVSKVSSLPSNVCLAVIAAPNQLHFTLAQEALALGAHVLIEKPFAIWPKEAKALVNLSAATGQVVAVNQTRRFMPYMSDLRKRIESGEFGSLRSIVHHEGYKLSWPYESGAAFSKTAQRTGVIMDAGAHVFDFYQYLFRPKWKLVSVVHDGFDGPEGLSELELEVNGAPTSVRLSRYQKQSNMACIAFDYADITVNLDGLNTYKIKKSNSIQYITASQKANSYTDLADRVLADFIDAVDGVSQPVSSAASSLPVIDLLDQIYNSASLYPTAVGAV